MSDDPTQLEPAQAATGSLEDLFNRDPLEYTKTDTDAIVAALRRQRAKFLEADNNKRTGQAKSRMVKNELKPTTAKPAKPTGPITLEGLGLGDMLALPMPEPKK